MFDTVQELVAAGRPATETWPELVRSARGRSRSAFWKTLESIDVAAELRRLRSWLAGALESEPPPPAIRAFWFGLHQPDEETTDLYVAGAKRFDDEGLEWAVRPAWWPERRYAGSRAIAEIHRAACRPRGPQDEGEYFCLWFAALAVAQLSGELAPHLLGKARSRHVAAGFDGGDFLVLGKLTGSGLAPHVPAPVKAVTAAQAPYYRIVDEHRGRWSLSWPVMPSGETLPSFASRCARYDRSARLRTTIVAKGAAVDFTFACDQSPVVSARVASMIQDLAPRAVQLIPIDVAGRPGDYEVLNVLDPLACLDAGRSQGHRFPPGHPDAGRLFGLDSIILDRSKAAGRSVFRLAEHLLELIVSRQVMERLVEAGVTGIRFEPVEVSSSSA